MSTAMIPDIVVDVGNTRIKWGRCFPDGGDIASLSPSDPRSWTQQAVEWELEPGRKWAVSGVHPKRREELVEWLRQRGDSVLVIDDPNQLPILVKLPAPEKVGIDRLLNAVAAKFYAGPGDASIIVDAGTAVTVDLVDETAAFCGGAILPGFRLMSQTLHDYTALLPLVDIQKPNPQLPGADTESAIRAGVFWAVAGGVKALVRQISAGSLHRKIFVTGGDAGLILPVLEADVKPWPTMTLEGIRIAAEALP